MTVTETPDQSEQTSDTAQPLRNEKGQFESAEPQTMPTRDQIVLELYRSTKKRNLPERERTARYTLIIDCLGWKVPRSKSGGDNPAENDKLMEAILDMEKRGVI